eukprot:GHVH01011110.1.p1 GENE.GHVH01011110.1~~GHVH01011110.1.p1  ORF type:complete len:1899 (-),score=257.75 GHVH01011110.1:125-5821(-)
MSKRRGQRAKLTVQNAMDNSNKIAVHSAAGQSQIGVIFSQFEHSYLQSLKVSRGEKIDDGPSTVPVNFDNDVVSAILGILGKLTKKCESTRKKILENLPEVIMDFENSSAVDQESIRLSVLPQLTHVVQHRSVFDAEPHVRRSLLLLFQTIARYEHLSLWKGCIAALVCLLVDEDEAVRAQAVDAIIQVFPIDNPEEVRSALTIDVLHQSTIIAPQLPSVVVDSLNPKLICDIFSWCNAPVSVLTMNCSGFSRLNSKSIDLLITRVHMTVILAITSLCKSACSDELSIYIGSQLFDQPNGLLMHSLQDSTSFKKNKRETRDLISPCLRLLAQMISRCPLKQTEKMIGWVRLIDLPGVGVSLLEVFQALVEATDVNINSYVYATDGGLLDLLILPETISLILNCASLMNSEDAELHSNAIKLVSLIDKSHVNATRRELIVYDMSLALFRSMFCTLTFKTDSFVGSSNSVAPDSSTVSVFYYYLYLRYLITKRFEFVVNDVEKFMEVLILGPMFEVIQTEWLTTKVNPCWWNDASIHLPPLPRKAVQAIGTGFESIVSPIVNDGPRCVILADRLDSFIREVALTTSYCPSKFSLIQSILKSLHTLRPSELSLVKSVQAVVSRSVTCTAADDDVWVGLVVPPYVTEEQFTELLPGIKATLNSMVGSREPVILKKISQVGINIGRLYPRLWPDPVAHQLVTSTSDQPNTLVMFYRLFMDDGSRLRYLQTHDDSLVVSVLTYVVDMVVNDTLGSGDTILATEFISGPALQWAKIEKHKGSMCDSIKLQLSRLHDHDVPNALVLFLVCAGLADLFKEEILGHLSSQDLHRLPDVLIEAEETKIINDWLHIRDNAVQSPLRWCLLVYKLHGNNCSVGATMQAYLTALGISSFVTNAKLIYHLIGILHQSGMDSMDDLFSDMRLSPDLNTAHYVHNPRFLLLLVTVMPATNLTIESRSKLDNIFKNYLLLPASADQIDHEVQSDPFPHTLYETVFRDCLANSEQSNLIRALVNASSTALDSGSTAQVFELLAFIPWLVDSLPRAILMEFVTESEGFLFSESGEASWTRIMSAYVIMTISERVPCDFLRDVFRGSLEAWMTRLLEPILANSGDAPELNNEQLVPMIMTYVVYCNCDDEITKSQLLSLCDFALPSALILWLSSAESSFLAGNWTNFTVRFIAEVALKCTSVLIRDHYGRAVNVDSLNDDDVVYQVEVYKTVDQLVELSPLVLRLMCQTQDDCCSHELVSTMSTVTTILDAFTNLCTSPQFQRDIAIQGAIFDILSSLISMRSGDDAEWFSSLTHCVQMVEACVLSVIYNDVIENKEEARGDGVRTLLLWNELLWNELNKMEGAVCNEPLDPASKHAVLCLSSLLRWTYVGSFMLVPATRDCEVMTQAIECIIDDGLLETSPGELRSYPPVDDDPNEVPAISSSRADTVDGIALICALCASLTGNDVLIIAKAIESLLARTTRYPWFLALFQPLLCATEPRSGSLLQVDTDCDTELNPLLKQTDLFRQVFGTKIIRFCGKKRRTHALIRENHAAAYQYLESCGIRTMLDIGFIQQESLGTLLIGASLRIIRSDTGVYMEGDIEPPSNPSLYDPYFDIQATHCPPPVRLSTPYTTEVAYELSSPAVIAPWAQAQCDGSRTSRRGPYLQYTQSLPTEFLGGTLGLLCLYSLGRASPSILREFCQLDDPSLITLQKDLKRLTHKTLSKRIANADVADATGANLSRSELLGKSTTVIYDASRNVLTCRTSDMDMEWNLEVAVSYSGGHPLETPFISIKRHEGIPDAEIQKGRMLLLSTLRGGNSRTSTTVFGGLAILIQNIRQHLAGYDDCPICYSVVHPSLKILPTFKCATCKIKFHKPCCVNWLLGARKNECPHCRQPFPQLVGDRRFVPLPTMSDEEDWA